MFKDKAEADQEFVDFINSLSDKHLILTHRRKEEYNGELRTGRWVHSGYKNIGHQVNLTVEMELNKKYDPASDDESKNWHYAASIRKCLHNIELEGPSGQQVLKDEFINFQMLMMCVFPQSEIGDWE